MKLNKIGESEIGEPTKANESKDEKLGKLDMVAARLDAHQEVLCRLSADVAEERGARAPQDPAEVPHAVWALEGEMWQYVAKELPQDSDEEPDVGLADAESGEAARVGLADAGGGSGRRVGLEAAGSGEAERVGRGGLAEAGSPDVSKAKKSKKKAARRAKQEAQSSVMETLTEEQLESMREVYEQQVVRQGLAERYPWNKFLKDSRARFQAHEAGTEVL